MSLVRMPKIKNKICFLSYRIKARLNLLYIKCATQSVCQFSTFFLLKQRPEPKSEMIIPFFFVKSKLYSIELS